MSNVVSFGPRPATGHSRPETVPPTAEALRAEAERLRGEKGDLRDLLGGVAEVETEDFVGALGLQIALLDLGLGDVVPENVPEALVPALLRHAEHRDLAAQPNSIRARRADMAAFAEWAAARWMPVLPSDPEELGTMVADHLMDLSRTARPSTVRRRASTLSRFARALGAAAEPFGERRRQAALAARAVVWTAGPPVPKPRLSPDDLRATLQAMANNPSIGEGVRIRDTALLRTAADILARPSEIANLRLGDLALEDESGEAMLFLARSRGPEGEAGIWCGISAATRAALLDWIDWAGLAGRDPGEPLFRAVARDGLPRSGRVLPLRSEAMNDIVTRHAAAAGLCAAPSADSSGALAGGSTGAGFGLRAIRDGHARALWERRVPIEEIALLGRWSSPARLRADLDLPVRRGGVSAYFAGVE